MDQTSHQEGFIMTAPVVYDSMFGTTATITEAIATGLRESMVTEGDQHRVSKKSLVRQP